MSVSNPPLPDVVIVDTGCANITSVYCAISRLYQQAGQPVQVSVSADPASIRAASRVIIPGVGTASQAMHNIHRKELAPVLQQLTQPVLGICLGMQLLTTHSSEGDVACLGVVPATVSRLQANGQRLPHMGWNTLDLPATVHPLLDGISARDYVYFVHSFAVEPGPYLLAGCHYGSDFAAVIGKDNFLGMQYHPERSGKTGARMLLNFLTKTPAELRA